MPRKSILHHFYKEIEKKLIFDNWTMKEVCEWLQQKGIKVTYSGLYLYVRRKRAETGYDKFLKRIKKEQEGGNNVSQEL